MYDPSYISGMMIFHNSKRIGGGIPAVNDYGERYPPRKLQLFFESLFLYAAGGSIPIVIKPDFTHRNNPRLGALFLHPYHILV